MANVILMAGLVGGGEGRWVPGSGMRRKVVPLRAPTWGALVVEMASMNARASLVALTPPTGMRALPDPPQHTQPTTRPGAYLDVPSLLDRTASARCRLLVHVDKPPVLSEARRWLS